MFSRADCSIAGGIYMAIGIEDFSKFIEENKGKRKFRQSVELAVNFRDLDFSKQDNRLNMDVNLPNGKGKVRKILLFATDRNLVEDAAKNGIEVADAAEMDKIAHDQKRLNSLLDYDLLAQASMMPSIAKAMGQFLGPRGKMPKPLLSGATPGAAAKDLTRRVEIKSKGKYLPTVHTVVGAEDMQAKELYDNILEVVGGISKKVGQNHIRSVYVKLTMSKPIKFM